MCILIVLLFFARLYFIYFALNIVGEAWQKQKYMQVLLWLPVAALNFFVLLGQLSS